MVRVRGLNCIYMKKKKRMLGTIKKGKFSIVIEQWAPQNAFFYNYFLENKSTKFILLFNKLIII